MVEQGTRVDRLVSIDVVERFEALQDEVDLLKNEIKQTLVDMREHMMKDRTVFSQPDIGPRNETPAPLPPRVIYAKQPRHQTSVMPSNGNSAMHSFGPFGPGSHGEGMDPIMMGKVIEWLGTVQQRGLKLQQVTPFLEAYEASGYLPPIMLKVLLRSLADLDQLTETPQEEEFSPERYAECIGELHDIICAADACAADIYEAQTVHPTDADSETGPGEVDQARQEDDGLVDSKLNGQKLNGQNLDESVETDAGRYRLTNIQVPDPDDDPENQEEEISNG
jgi:hypothetical protein